MISSGRIVPGTRYRRVVTLRVWHAWAGMRAGGGIVRAVRAPAGLPAVRGRRRDGIVPGSPGKLGGGLGVAWKGGWELVLGNLREGARCDWECAVTAN